MAPPPTGVGARSGMRSRSERCVEPFLFQCAVPRLIGQSGLFEDIMDHPNRVYILLLYVTGSMVNLRARVPVPVPVPVSVCAACVSVCATMRVMTMCLCTGLHY
eukprot:COSAG01_NODE_2747_length_7149_cov_5.321844_1_plen_104_part_00